VSAPADGPDVPISECGPRDGLRNIDRVMATEDKGTVRIFVRGRRVEHQAAMALVKRSPTGVQHEAMGLP
jgi:hypothetical protein